MGTIIAMQDIRQSLAAIANRVKKGEHFIVVRNSRPVFRIEPVDEPYESGPPSPPLTVREVRDRFAANPVAEDELSPAELDEIVREARRSPKA